jgi:hypothetical protein
MTDEGIGPLASEAAAPMFFENRSLKIESKCKLPLNRLISTEKPLPERISGKVVEWLAKNMKRLFLLW